MLPQIADAIRGVEQLFRDEWTTSAEVYLPVARAGHARAQPRARRDLPARARGGRGALERPRRADRSGARPVVPRLRGRGDDALLRAAGSTARANGTAACSPRTTCATGGRAYEEPLAVDYHGLTVLKAGPWSQAPVFLQQLRLLEGFDLQALGHGSAPYVHVVTECAKLAFADREAWYGDPDFADVPLDELLSRDYADERRKLVGEDGVAASCSPARPTAVRRGSPGSTTAELAEAAGSASRRAPARRATPCTSTSSTASGTWSRRRRAAAGSGARRSSRSSASASARARRCSGSRKGCRTRSSRASGRGRRSRRRWCARDGEPYLALGTPGGDQQDQWTLHTFLGARPLRARPPGGDRRAEPPHGGVPELVLPARDATAARRGRGRVGEKAIGGLRERGHDVERAGAVVARPRQRRRPRARRRAEGSGQPARRAGLRRRALNLVKSLSLFIETVTGQEAGHEMGGADHGVLTAGGGFVLTRDLGSPGAACARLTKRVTGSARR